MPLPPLYEKSLSDASSFSGLLSEYSLIICLEFLDPGIGKRMFGHLNDNFIRNGGDISSCQGAVGYMDRVADAGCDDLCVDIFCHVENVCDLTNQVDAVAGNIIDSSEERRNVGCASPGCEKSLVCRENQGHVGLDALGRKDFDCFQSLYGHGDGWLQSHGLP